MDLSHKPAQDILDELARTACGPVESATALPKEIYHSSEIHALERRCIFARDWLCPGLAAEIPEPGDYLTYSIADQPVFIQRGDDGEIRTFANVCRHRLMELVQGRGTCRRIVCPYHGWTYDLSGRLIGAGHMERSSGFSKSDIALPQIRTQIWHGWIYITLNDDAAPVAESLQALDGLVARYHTRGYVPVISQDHLWNTNWKLLCENFMEGYHLPVAHRATIGPWTPADGSRFPDDTYDAFTYQTFTKTGEARYGLAHKDNTALTGDWRFTSILGTIYPSHMFVLAPDHLWYLTLRPEGTGQVHVRFGVALAPEAHAAMDNPDEEVAALTAFFDDVNAEDRYVVEGIYKGSKAPLATSGPLSWLEREIHDFAGYLHRRMTG